LLPYGGAMNKRIKELYEVIAVAQKEIEQIQEECRDI
jgi:hypothetical protein